MTDDTTQPGFVPVYEPGSGKLLLRICVERSIIEVKRRGIKTLIDLQKIKQERDEQKTTNNG